MFTLYTLSNKLKYSSLKLLGIVAVEFTFAHTVCTNTLCANVLSLYSLYTLQYVQIRDVKNP